MERLECAELAELAKSERLSERSEGLVLVGTAPLMGWGTGTGWEMGCQVPDRSQKPEAMAGG